jgi:hypothetical protein
MKFTFGPETSPLDGYTIKRAIHRGGFGEVYYALSDAGKEVALKLLNNNLEVELRGVTQCLNLKHQNLVTIFDIRQDTDGDHWIVMEYVGGRGLYETLQDHPEGMSVSDVLFWLSGMVAGLSFLHDRGIVHRDLKPANVFSDHGVVKIGDVGLSKYISESRRSAQTQSVGTVYYMAPEVAKGRYGREVDVYALGIILFEMLTGRVPFDGQTTAEILMKHLTADPDLSVLPESIRPVLAAALEKDPDKRIADVEELERQFRQAVTTGDQPIDVRQPVFARFAAPAPDKAPDQPAEPAKPVERPKPALQAGRPAASAATQQAPRAVAASASQSPWMSLLRMWNDLPAPAKWVVGGAAALLIIDLNLLRPVASGGLIGAVCYASYQILRWILVPADRRSGKVDADDQPEIIAESEPDVVHDEQWLQEHPAARQAPQPTRFRGPRHSRVPVRAASVPCTPETIRIIPRDQRLVDTTTSLCMSLAAAGLVTVAIYLSTNLLAEPQHAVYFGLITMLAAWALIFPAKMWEGRIGDGVSRRLLQGSLGLGVGFIAGVLSRYLMMDHDSLFGAEKAGGQVQVIGRITLTDGTGFPTIASYMLFFAALFMIRRWWWQADSFRKSRFRVSTALVTLIIGAVLTAVLPAFPDTLGATWALAISAVVQLSAGWTPHEDRLAGRTDAVHPGRMRRDSSLEMTQIDPRSLQEV